MRQPRRARLWGHEQRRIWELQLTIVLLGVLQPNAQRQNQWQLRQLRIRGRLIERRDHLLVRLRNVGLECGNRLWLDQEYGNSL